MKTLKSIACYPCVWLCFFVLNSDLTLRPFTFAFAVKFRREFKKAFLCRHSRRPAWIRSYSFSQRSVSMRARLPANTEHLSMTEMPARSEQHDNNRRKNQSPLLPHAAKSPAASNSLKNGAKPDFLSPYTAARTTSPDGMA